MSWFPALMTKAKEEHYEMLAVDLCGVEFAVLSKSKDQGSMMNAL